MESNFCLFRLKNELKSLYLLEGSSYTLNDLTITYIVLIHEGIFKNKTIHFLILIPQEYPFKSPKIKCLTKLFHPCIDKEGNTCLEILRENWKCTYGIQNILVNLYTIFVDLECETPLNNEAYEIYKNDLHLFKQKNSLYFDDNNIK